MAENKNSNQKQNQKIFQVEEIQKKVKHYISNDIEIKLFENNSDSELKEEEIQKQIKKYEEIENVLNKTIERIIDLSVKIEKQRSLIISDIQSQTYKCFNKYIDLPLLKDFINILEIRKQLEETCKVLNFDSNFEGINKNLLYWNKELDEFKEKLHKKRFNTEQNNIQNGDKNKNKEDIKKFCEDNLKSKNPIIMYIIGICYQEGIGVNKNLEEAVKLFEKANELNYAYAIYILFTYYETGKGGKKKDIKKVIECLEKSAKLGDTHGNFLLACMYEKGNSNYNIEKDEKKAFEMFEELIKLGNITAICRLGYCYYEKKDYQNAIKYLEQAFNLDNILCINTLADCYGLQGNLDKAVELCEEAIKLNYTDKALMYNIGTIYYYESSYYYEKQENFKKAIKWYKQAAILGSDNAKKELEKLNKITTELECINEKEKPDKNEVLQYLKEKVKTYESKRFAIHKITELNNLLKCFSEKEILNLHDFYNGFITENELFKDFNFDTDKIDVIKK